MSRSRSDGATAAVLRAMVAVAAPPAELLVAVLCTVPKFDAAYLQRGKVHFQLLSVSWKKLVTIVIKHRAALSGRLKVRELSDFAVQRLERALRDVSDATTDRALGTSVKMAKFFTTQLVALCEGGGGVKCPSRRREPLCTPPCARPPFSAAPGMPFHSTPQLRTVYRAS